MIRALVPPLLWAFALMPNKQPWVSVACLCEKVLREPDGVLSAIRIVDLFTVSPEAVADKMSAELTALIVLKAGEVRGRSEVAMRLRMPDGTTHLHPSRHPILLQGKGHSAAVITQMQLPIEIGYYELTVLWNDQELTTVPFQFRLPPAAAPEK